MYCLVSDTDVASSEGEFVVKVKTDVSDPFIIFKLAQGHRSQNFVDELFRAIQSR